MNSSSSRQKYRCQPMLMCRSRLIALYCVSTNSLRTPLLRLLESVKSMIRYAPPKGTAGFARSRVSGSRRDPLPPARMTAITSYLIGNRSPPLGPVVGQTAHILPCGPGPLKRLCAGFGNRGPGLGGLGDGGRGSGRKTADGGRGTAEGQSPATRPRGPPTRPSGSVIRVRRLGRAGPLSGSAARAGRPFRRGQAPGRHRRKRRWWWGRLKKSNGPGNGGRQPGPKKANGLKRVTSKDVRRELTRKSGESPGQFLHCCGRNIAERLKAAGLPVTINPAGTGSVYLKHAEFEVRITDHKPERGTQVERSGGPRYGLLIKGTTASARQLTELLTKIVAKHAP